MLENNNHMSTNVNKKIVLTTLICYSFHRFGSISADFFYILVKRDSVEVSQSRRRRRETATLKDIQILKVYLQSSLKKKQNSPF